MKYLFLLIPFLSGCAFLPETKQVGSVEGLYAFPFSTDFWQHQYRPWSCEPPQVRFKWGRQTKNKWSAGVYHESFPLCGGPLNRKPEIYENGLYVKKNWGGW